MRCCAVAGSVALCFLLCFSGCREAEPEIDPPGSDAISALDYVNKVQMGKMTTGTARFLPDSVVEQGNGKFRYKDTAGAIYEVSVTKGPDDEYQMSEPTPVK